MRLPPFFRLGVHSLRASVLTGHRTPRIRFAGAPNILVLCECIAPNMEPIPTNTRRNADLLFSRKLEEIPWFGLEQEYTLFNPDKRTPLGWPKGGYPGAQGPYYCSVGADNSFGRLVVEAHYKACMYAGIKISGINGTCAHPALPCHPSCVHTSV